MKTVFKVIGIIILVVAVLVAALLGFLYYVIYKAPAVPNDYIKQIKNGGADKYLIEAKYLENGAFKVKSFEEKSEKPVDKLVIFYPEELENSDKKYPVVSIVNGTGIFANKSKPLFEHLASWGFIVIGNHDPSTCSGESADKSLARLLELNADKNSVFYNKVDETNIGLTGHSQGGVGVFNAASNYEREYKCIVSLSPTELEMAAALGMNYDPSLVKVPVLLLAGTENDVISLDGMNAVFEKISGFKAMARRSKQNHGEMLYAADGYVTAWFMWLLQGDENAAKAFTGENPELMHNELYQDQQHHIYEN